jgi:hypothetical protein
MCSGLNAHNTVGCIAIPYTPNAAIVRNHITITGPNNNPIRCVPRLCSKNSPASTPTVIGTMNGSAPDVATFRPSTDDNTETAGVITPSPNSIPAPTKIKNVSQVAFGGTPRFIGGSTNASSARIPPSPSCATRMIIPMYRTNTIRISDHRIRLRRPSTFSWLGSMCIAPVKHWRNAYSGLVPMSPKTIPTAASASVAAVPLRSGLASTAPGVVSEALVTRQSFPDWRMR